MGVRVDVGLVGDYDERLALRVQFLEQLHDLHGRLGVQVARRLVGQQHGGVVGERAGDGNALALAAGQLGRQVRQAMLHLHALGKLLRAARPLVWRHPEIEHRHLDVLQHRELRDEVEALEHESEVLQAMVGELVVLHARHVHAVEPV